LKRADARLRQIQLRLVVQLVEQHDGNANGDNQADGYRQSLHQPLPDLPLFRYLVGIGFLAIGSTKRGRANGSHRALCLGKDGYSVIVRADHPGKMVSRPYRFRHCA
jgi:hypothetical protein